MNMLPGKKQNGNTCRIFILAVFISALFPPGAGAMGQNLPKGPGLYFFEYPLENGGTGRFTLSLPRLPPSPQKVPLIIALHYAGKVTPYFGRGILEQLIEPALRDLGAVIAAPDCPGSGWTESRSMAAVEMLINRLKKDYPIDAGKILLVGYSMGAIGTWAFAARENPGFSAAVAISGIPDPSQWPKTIHLPLLAIHSRADEIFPYARVQALVKSLKKAGCRVEIEPVAGPTHYEVERFITPLRKAIPWIKKIWESRPPDKTLS